ncbi:MAG: hypothetical protein PF570_10190 [Candidatus Cloacimonetes bacterium]|jgi:hypothetical protein|nr:hypothetical protein [Candidatus Cloacimonadota bacterium]
MTDYKDMSLKDAVKYVPARVVNAINKLLGMKGIVLAGTIYLFKKDIIPPDAIGYTWIFIVLIIVFGEKSLTFIKELKK